MRDTFISELTKMARVDPRIILITGDLGFGVLNDYRSELPKQFLNVGVAEQNMTGVAAGMALEGYVVYTYSIANFVFMRCLEQIRNDAAYHDLNVNVVCIGAGFSYGPLGMSHHATEDLAIMRSMPGVSVVSPSDLWETARATRAVADIPGVSYLRLDKSAATTQAGSEEEFRLGQVRTIREGNDITLAATGGILAEVMLAADQLAESGIEARVLSVHTIKPLDTPAFIRAARETGGIVTVEEHNVVGGLGGAVAEELLESGYVPRVFARIGIGDIFCATVGSQQYLRKMTNIDHAAIVKKVHELLSRM